MAGSHRSPVLKDQWRGSGDVGDQRGRERHRPRGSHRDRGKDRFRDRDRLRRPKEGRPDRSSRSPPPRSFPGPDDEPQHRDFSSNIASTRGSPGPSHPGIRSSQKPNRLHSPGPIDHRAPDSPVRSVERSYRREDSPSAPPSKRKRTRSPSPSGFHSRPPTHPRGAPPRQGYDFDRSLPHSKRRGRLPGRGRPSRRPSPRRGRDRRKYEGGHRDSSRPRNYSRSPGYVDRPYTHSSRRFHSPLPDDDTERGSYYRSPSHHSAGTLDSRPSAHSRRGSRGDVTMYPPSSPSRSNIDSVADTNRIPADTGASRARLTQRRRPSRSPANSYQGSTRSNSPYSAARGGRSGQHHSHHSQHGSRQSNPSGNESPIHSSHSLPHPSHHVTSHGYRDGQQRYREPHQDRRLSASGPSGAHPHARSHFNSPQRDALDSRNRAGPPSPPPQGPPAEIPPPPPPPTEPRSYREAYQNTSNNRPTSRDSRADEGLKHDPGTGTGQTAQSEARPPDTSSIPNKGGKISFAFKAKTGPPSAPKPVPDLAQRMLAREPPPRAPEPPRNRMSTGPPARFKPEPRFDRRDRDRDRDRHRDRDRNNRGRNDRRDYREPRGFRDPRDYRDNRRDDRRVEHRQDKRRNDKVQDFRPERRHDRSPEPVKRPKIMLRPKPRPTISDEFAKSDSVYFRKPGNESVIGAGTYGKVFKAIHVYTQQKVALKKIRMEGEKDGFPVTAVREIKLLQHLRNHNVVSLLEVMVERNECFMVFEYLSHDLTGLINHPTFTLTAAHKKDLAKQMFGGLSYLHHRGVLHRDIKAANILISNQGRLKYADFGLARFFSKSRQLDYTNRVITIWYRPPELLLGETRYGPPVDVWSAACVYVEMFTKKAVFPGEGGEISQLDKLYNTLGTPTRTEWPDIVEMPWFELMRPTERKKRVFEDVYQHTLSPAALDMVSQVFRYDPAKRPTAEEVLAHPYFNSEEPSPQQPIELEEIQGDWHEFESKALRKERDREARRAEYQKDKEKRKSAATAQDEREPKRIKQDTTDGLTPSAPQVEQQ